MIYRSASTLLNISRYTVVIDYSLLTTILIEARKLVIFGRLHYSVVICKGVIV